MVVLGLRTYSVKKLYCRLLVINGIIYRQKAINIEAGRTGEKYRCFYGRGCSLVVTGFRPLSPIVNDIDKRYFVSIETLYLFFVFTYLIF